MDSVQRGSQVTVTALAGHRFLHGLTREQLAELVPAARPAEIPAGRRLFEDGGRADGFWLIRSGSVAMDLHVPGEGQVIVETLGMGDALGWSWLVPPYQSNTAKAARSSASSGLR